MFVSFPGFAPLTVAELAVVCAGLDLMHLIDDKALGRIGVRRCVDLSHQAIIAFNF